MMYRNICAELQEGADGTPEGICLYNNEEKERSLLFYMPEVGTEIKEASRVALEEFARKYIDVNYRELQKHIFQPVPVAETPLSQMAHQYAEALQDVANYMVEQGRLDTMDGNWIMDFAEIEDVSGLDLAANPQLKMLIYKITCDNEAVENVIIDNEKGRFDMDFDPDFCPKVFVDEAERAEQNEEPGAPTVIDVLVIQPGEAPQRESVKDELSTYQEIVGGYIEPITLGDICILVNEDGKTSGLLPNRRLGGDILVGPMILCGFTEEGEFASLTEPQTEKYEKMFAEPDTFSMQEQLGLLGYTM